MWREIYELHIFREAILCELRRNRKGEVRVISWALVWFLTVEQTTPFPVSFILSHSLFPQSHSMWLTWTSSQHGGLSCLDF